MNILFFFCGTENKKKGKPEIFENAPERILHGI